MADPEFLHDWITVWQSELTALATDREAQETWCTAVGLMSAAMQTMADLAASAGESPNSPPGRAGTAPTAWPPAAFAAFDAEPDAWDSQVGDQPASQRDIERLARRVAELERQLAAANARDDPKD